MPLSQLAVKYFLGFLYGFVYPGDCLNGVEANWFSEELAEGELLEGSDGGVVDGDGGFPRASWLQARPVHVGSLVGVDGELEVLRGGDDCVQDLLHGRRRVADDGDVISVGQTVMSDCLRHLPSLLLDGAEEGFDPSIEEEAAEWTSLTNATLDFQVLCGTVGGEDGGGGAVHDILKDFEHVTSDTHVLKG